MPRVYMNADDGRLSAGHVYTVSDKEFKRLIGSRRKVRTVVSGRERTEMQPVAVVATQAHLAARRNASPPEQAVLVRMTHDRGKHTAGRTYAFSPAIASKICDGYTSGGRRFQPTGKRVDPAEIEPEPPAPFKLELVPGVSRALATKLEAEGLGQPREILKAGIRQLVAIPRVGAKTAEAIIAAARQHEG